MKRIKKDVDRNLMISTSDGVYSDNNANRLSLNITWPSSNQKKKAVAIGINPSKANDSRSDKTITTLARFLDAYGFTELTMLNLFQSYSTSQSGIEKSSTTDFTQYKNVLDQSDAIIIVWGVNNSYSQEKKSVLKQLTNYKEKIYCISKNNSYPLHPARMSYDSLLEKYKF